MSNVRIRSTGAEKAGCIVGGFFLLLNLAWISFLIWAVYTLVTWVASK